MVRFDEMLDGIINTTKHAAKFAGQKTGELMEFGKLKYRAQGLARDLQKSYAKLGAIVYEAKVNGEELEELTQTAIDDITALSEQLDHIEYEVKQVKETLKQPIAPVEPEPIEVTVIEDDITTTPEELEVIQLEDAVELNMTASQVVRDNVLRFEPAADAEIPAEAENPADTE